MVAQCIRAHPCYPWFSWFLHPYSQPPDVIDTVFTAPKQSENFAVVQPDHARVAELEPAQLLAGGGLAGHSRTGPLPERRLGEVDPLFSLNAGQIGPKAGLIIAAIKAQDPAVAQVEELSCLALEAGRARGGEAAAVGGEGVGIRKAAPG